MKKQQKKKSKVARKPSKPAKEKRPSIPRENLDVKEKVERDFRKQALSGQDPTLGMQGMERPDLAEEPAEESSASAPETQGKKPGGGKTEEEKPEAASVQRDQIPLKGGPGPEGVNEGQAGAPSEATPVQDAPGALKNETPTETLAEAVKEAIPEKTETGEPESKFATQRETIEELNPREIQPFQTIPDYLEPTSSLYPIVVRSQTPPSIICIEGSAMIQEAIDAGQPTIRCRIYDLAEVSVEELAVRKLTIRVVPEGGFDSYAERARNYTKCKELLLSTNESLAAFAHGGARRGISFVSERERNVNRILAARSGKSEETTRKYSLHGSYLNDGAFQELVEGRADSKFFQSIQKVKSKLVENLKRQRVSDADVINRVSKAVLQMFRDENEIAKIWESLTRTQPDQGTPPAQTAASQAEDTIAHEQEGGEPQEHEGGQKAEEIEAEEGGEEEEEQTETEEAETETEPDERPEPPVIATAPTESKEDQTFDDEQIRRRGIEIAEELRVHFANSEISLSTAKEAIRGLIESLEQLLDRIPEA